MTSTEGPWLLENNLVENVWGGDWLPQLKKLPKSSRPIGESWEFSTHPEHPGYAINSDGRRVPLNSLVGEAGILVKLIDARENLSLQVHPTDDFARRHENSSGKAESWLFLNEGAVYLGFDRARLAAHGNVKSFSEAFRAAVASAREKEILPFLNRISVKAGDVVHVPPGTLHAIGAGVRLFEIQQSSGITYRLWDWNRGSRALHLEKGFAVLDFDAAPPSPNGGGSLKDPLGHYTAEVRRLSKESGSSAEKTAGNFLVVTVVEGEVELSPGGVVVPAGRSAFVPASHREFRVTSRGNAALFVLSRPG